MNYSKNAYLQRRIAIRVWLPWLSLLALTACTLVCEVNAQEKRGPAARADEPRSTMALTSPRGLTCEHLKDPLGIDELHPRLSWKLQADDESLRGQKQSAYRILVASQRSLLDQDSGNLWDSGPVESDRSILIEYAGQDLSSYQKCWWKVQVWDQDQRKTSWSKPAFWSMGILKPEQWQGAQWIGLDEAHEESADLSDIKASNWLWYPEGNAAHDAPVATRYFRCVLTLPADRKVRRAYALFAGDDQCVFYVNGTQVGVGHGHPGMVMSEIRQNFHAGENQLAVAATNAKADVPNNPGGWISAVRIEFHEGPPLVIHSDKSWKSSKAAPAGWETGAFDSADWLPAQELGKAGIAPWGIPWKDRLVGEHRKLPARYLRREFDGASKQIEQATVHICGLGFFDLHFNGERVGDQLMAPALTGYDQRNMVVTFDVTDRVKVGGNALGVVLSNGRFFAPRSHVPMPMVTYGYPKMLLKMRIVYADGSEQIIDSDQSWKLTTDGPVRASSEFDGEEYDAQKSMPGWDTATFDDAHWSAAQKVSAPGGQLQSQMLEPIRVIRHLKPIKLVEPKPGIWMADFGQAFYGVVQLRVEGPAGTQVSMRTSFNVNAEGLLNFKNDRSALNTDLYTLAGKGVEVWHPRFRGNATRWVQVEGFPGTPTLESFTGLVTHTDHEEVGKFECSNPLINRVFQNAVWGTRMQNRSVPMEPDRDERMPWSGHPAKTSESEGWVFNVARFYAHFLHNYRVHQAADGSLQEILPPYWQFNSKDIIWPSVATIIPDWYYNFYGDDRPLRDNYDMMKRFVEYHQRTNLKADGTLDHCIYGDWVDTASIGGNARNFGATSRPLMGTAYFYHNCRILERTARLLGKSGDERTFGELADRVKVAFNQRFFDKQNGRYESATQCSYVLPLAFDLVPAEHRDAVIKNLVEDVMVQHRGHTSVGLIGMQWLMQTLTDIGHPEVAYSIATRTERPSWGYMISKGATTSWERWDTDTQDGGMNGESQKILSGNFEAWCFQALGGINYDTQVPGFKHIILRPRLVGDLTWVRTSHASLYGEIRSDWKINDDLLEWTVTVPANTSATVYVPTRDRASIRESNQSIEQSPSARNVNFERVENGAVVYQVGSGTYNFTAKAHVR